MSNDKDEAHWKQVERIVAVLEKLLTPGSVVEHNQYLTEPATGNERQCDVVVRSGRPPRQTLTIVEVQDREKKVNIGTYEGWCKKREKLGVQHLICVSAKGFPKSVLKDAALQGETVRLTTLCEPDDFPEAFLARSILYEMEVLCTRDAEIVFDREIPPQVVGVRVDARAFEIDGRPGLISIMELADEFRANGLILDYQSAWVSANEQLRTYRLDFGTKAYRLSLRDSAGSTPVTEIRIVDKIETYRHDAPLRMFAYEQIGIKGVLAYAIIATAYHEGHELVIRIPIIPLSDGRLGFGQIEFSRIPGMTILSHATQLLVDASAKA